MRILITGSVFFVLWCIVSAWLYNDKLLPVINLPAAIQTVPVLQTNEADSLMKLRASIPADLLFYFEFNDFNFKPDAEFTNSIIPFKVWLEKYPASMLTVAGHTDLVGTNEYNYDLGLKRAQTVEKYLEKQGIKSNRMITESKGETSPGADYITPEGRAKDRRTEISIKMQ